MVGLDELNKYVELLELKYLAQVRLGSHRWCSCERRLLFDVFVIVHSLLFFYFRFLFIRLTYQIVEAEKICIKRINIYRSRSERH